MMHAFCVRGAAAVLFSSFPFWTMRHVVLVQHSALLHLLVADTNDETNTARLYGWCEKQHDRTKWKNKTNSVTNHNRSFYELHFVCSITTAVKEQTNKNGGVVGCCINVFHAIFFQFQFILLSDFQFFTACSCILIIKYLSLYLFMDNN